MSGKNELETYTTAIRQGWQKVTTSILEVARVCSEADIHLSSSDKKRLFDAVPIRSATFSKLVQIARDVRLTDENIRGLLPSNYSTIYELTQLTDVQLQTAITDKVLNPEVRREDLIKWRKGKATATESNRFPLYAHLYLTKELSSEGMNQLRQSLDQLGLTFELKILRPEDFHNGRTSNWGERVLNQMRREARKVVRQYLKNKIAPIPGKKISEVGHIQEEITIESDADEKRILQVLQGLGSGDEMEGVRSRALKKYPMPAVGPYSYWPPQDQVIDDSVLNELRSSRKKRKNDITRFADFK